MKNAIAVMLSLCLAVPAMGQSNDLPYNQVDEYGNVVQRANKNKNDSLKSDKEIPKGIKVWTVDSRFGDIKTAIPDTVSHMFMNSIFTEGMRGEYNTTGNLGSPRINRIFIERPEVGQFIFTAPYDYFVQPENQFHFTNTLSPFTNLTYNNAGDRVNGEDHFIAKFGVNANKRLGVGFKFDYLYGRGYYQNQSTSHFDYSMYGSYLGERYQMHFLISTNHQKVTENGGLTNDNYITHPESYNDTYASDEIPTMLSKNWNRNDNQHVFLTHRYSLGFNRKVPMTEDEIKAKKFAMASKKEQAQKKLDKETPERRKDEPAMTFAGRPDDAKVMGHEPVGEGKGSERVKVNGKTQADSLLAVEKKKQEDSLWLKNDYVPVTSFIHTLNFDNYRRIYQAYATPTDFYAQTYNVAEKFSGDSIYDQTKHYSLKNTFAISLLEGFNKWAKAGLKGFFASELRHFTLPDSVGGTSTYNEHNLSVGAQLYKHQGKTLHYDAIFETWLTGEDAGQMKLDATADLNFKLLGDTVKFSALGFFHRLNPTFYYRHYHSRHFWWDNDDMSKMLHTRLQAMLMVKKTRTSLRVAVDNIKNYTYFAQSYLTTDDSRYNYQLNVLQNKDAINLFTASLSQDFTLGPLSWENVITYQKSSKNDVLPVPSLNVYSNLFLKFKIAHVLKCEFGADARYFTKYYAPDYSPALGQYAVQVNTDTSGSDSRVEIGNYPIVNIYANFHLKHTRFFIMMSHVNAGSGNRNYFMVPHYALNDRTLRFGLSWNFFN